MEPDITVLMPVYNSERYLKAAIESVLGQTFLDFELLIINDGSTDRSMDIIDSFHDARIRVVNQQRNRGLVQALNFGVSLAKGTYIARMDSDDICSPERLRLQYDFLERNLAINMVGTAAMVYGTNEVWRQPEESQDIRCHLLFHCCFVHPTVMLRKSLFTSWGMWYDSNFPHAEDYDLWVRLASEMPLANLSAPLLMYRQHDHQVSKVFHLEQEQSTNRIYRRQLERLGIEPTDAELIIHRNPWNYYGSQQLMNWLIKIWNSNQQCGLYEPSTLRKILSSYGLSI